MAVAGAYRNYRSSGLPWVPRLPEDWQVLRNGRLFAHRVETGFPDLPILEVSLRTGVRVRDMENLKRKQVMSQKEKYKRAAKGDIAYNMMRMWQGAVGPAPVDGLVSPAYVVVKPYDEANSSYYSYLFRTAAYMQEVNKFSRGIVADRNRLYWESFKQMPSLVPPRPEQDQIVAYLRAQDAHIARFIKNKRDLIKLLTEQKLRIIDHAVTRGLDATVTLKPSGIEWLSEVPEHWEVVHIGSAVQIVNGYPFDSGLFDAFVGHPLVRIRDLNRTHTEVRLNGPEVPEAVINTGDLIVGMDGDFNVARWRGERALLNQRMCCLRPRKQITTEYLALIIPKALKFINDLTLSTTVKHLSSGDVKRLRFPIPDETEQLQIVAHVQAETAPINDAITRAEEEIKLIREYRDRLIVDVVTGQVDVRGSQPSPDDVVDDTALAALSDDPEDVTEVGDDDGEY
ncbi:restriction endonuclease subunit S [Luteibacter yeojuensis]|uniref:Restriction endonuclease subunit S n=1 Tax=Luteibacter yeojuensis TaxID=345309 RepID=A0A7X5QVZ6_9GAMM|nr:restriction endonuclease subunit S [Luteibacter yeojuensis]NID16332.1 restriction endonuclease subunit S [Luteibacter yeojuensis]